jgi:hypothetical protein
MNIYVKQEIKSNTRIQIKKRDKVVLFYFLTKVLMKRESKNSDDHIISKLQHCQMIIRTHDATLFIYLILNNYFIFNMLIM